MRKLWKELAARLFNVTPDYSQLHKQDWDWIESESLFFQKYQRGSHLLPEVIAGDGYLSTIPSAATEVGSHLQAYFADFFPC